MSSAMLAGADTGATVRPPAATHSGTFETDTPVRRRRWPWLSGEDYRTLVALDEAGRSDVAEELERLIHSQADADRRADAHEMLESDLAGGSVDWIASERAARASFGTGGGRVRRPAKAGPDA